MTVLTFNTPHLRNRISPAFRSALIDALSAANANPDTSVIVLAGSGGHFCSGGDLSSMTEREPKAARDRMDDAHRVTRLLQHSPKPTIAAVEGVAYGAGFTIALACDQIVASSTARFCAIYARAALLPDYGMMYFLPRRVGMGRATRMMMLSTVVSADEGLRDGLVDTLVPEDGALAAALSLAGEFKAVGPLSTMLIKRVLSQGRCNTLEDTLAAELDLQPLLLSSADFAEAAEAFASKRPPVFSGK